MKQDSKQVQVDLQDLGYETCGRSENEADREESTSPGKSCVWTQLPSPGSALTSGRRRRGAGELWVEGDVGPERRCRGELSKMRLGVNVQFLQLLFSILLLKKKKRLLSR